MLIEEKNGVLYVLDSEFTNCSQLKHHLSKNLNLDENSYYITVNGKIVQDNCDLIRNNGVSAPFILVPRLLGGKGGFGSMLRAIGAQIEKTTNRDACRDLSGRRLRDINEEQRLKKWFESQDAREAEAEAKRKKKLERLRAVAEGPPLPKLDDKEYHKKRTEISDDIFDAVDKGLGSSCTLSVSEALSGEKSLEKEKSEKPSTSATSSGSSGDEKPKIELVVPAEKKAPPQKKKLKKLMLDDDLDVSSSDSDEEITPAKKSKYN